MPHPYPPHHPSLPYTGKHYYFLTFCTDGRETTFADPDAVELVRTQFMRAAVERHFELTAYCFMPDHVHLLVHGLGERSDCKAFISAAKQYSGYYFGQRRGRRLWQRYGFERVVRDERELVGVLAYIILNPVRSGLAKLPGEYPFLGSECFTVDEMSELCADLDPDVFWQEGTPSG